MIMDRIIDGHKDEKVKDKLMRQDKLDLKATLNICRAMEITSENMKVIKGQNEAEINRVMHKMKANSVQGAESVQKTCKFCTYSHPLKREKCPVWGQVCKCC